MCQLSVIIPTCNRNDLLHQAVMSVISQDITDYEIVIVDDSTQPRKPDFFDKLSKIATIRYVINEGEHGAALARNKGVEVALGTYVTFLDDDDLYMPGRLSNMLSIMRSDKYVFVSSSRFYQFDDFKRVNVVPKQLKGVVSLNDIYKANDIDIGFMLKKETFLMLGGFDSGFHNLEDWDFVIRMTQLGNGYKIDRLDYCVNVSTDRVRVSDNDWVGYSQILDRYSNVFSHDWSVFIRSTILRLRNDLHPSHYFLLSLKSRSFVPIMQYFKFVFRMLIKTSRK